MRLYNSLVMSKLFWLAEVCVCVYVCMYVCDMAMYVGTYVDKHVHVCVCWLKAVLAAWDMCVCTYVCMHVRMGIYAFPNAWYCINLPHSGELPAGWLAQECIYVCVFACVRLLCMYVCVCVLCRIGLKHWHASPCRSRRQTPSRQVISSGLMRACVSGVLCVCMCVRAWVCACVCARACVLLFACTFCSFCVRGPISSCVLINTVRINMYLYTLL